MVSVKRKQGASFPTQEELTMELLTRSTLKTFILTEVKAGRFVTVNFVKKDGSDRKGYRDPQGSWYAPRL